MPGKPRSREVANSAFAPPGRRPSQCEKLSLLIDWLSEEST